MDCAFINRLVGMGTKALLPRYCAASTYPLVVFGETTEDYTGSSVVLSLHDCDEYTVRAAPQNTRETLCPGKQKDTANGKAE